MRSFRDRLPQSIPDAKAADGTGRDNPCLFLVGCPRSGTTLLQRMMDHHPLLAVANDTHFIPRALEIHDPNLLAPATAGQSLALTPELVDAVGSYHRFRRLGATSGELEESARSASTYQQLVRVLFTRFAARHGKPWAGDKTPDYVRYLPLLGGLFPTSQFIHLVRDGRDVALSLMSWAPKKRRGPAKLTLWEENPLATCALWWRWLVLAGHQAGSQLGADHYLEVRYERLVSEPQPIADRCCQFLGLRPATEMIRFHQGREAYRHESDPKKAWLPPTRGLRDWRRDMASADQQLFEALAGDALEQLNYPRCHPTLPDSVQRQAIVYQQMWLADRRVRCEKTERRIRPRSDVPPPALRGAEC